MYIVDVILIIMNINGNRIDRLSNGIYRNIDLIFYHLEEEKKKKNYLLLVLALMDT